MFKVDVFIPPMRPFLKEQISRAYRQVLVIEPRVEALISTAEDTVLVKLEWYCMGGEICSRAP